LLTQGLWSVFINFLVKILKHDKFQKSTHGREQNSKNIVEIDQQMTLSLVDQFHYITFRNHTHQWNEDIYLMTQWSMI